MNSVLKRYVSYKNNMLQFFQHFQRLIDDRRYKEMREDLRNSQSTPELPFRVEILKHAVSVYTHEVFRKFQIEVSKAYDSTLELCSETRDLSKYKITPYRKHHKKFVTYNSSTCEVSCSCRKFEFAGILCSHALTVLSFRKVVRIPEIHIKKRWTKKAKKGLGEGQPFHPHDTLVVPMNETDEKKMIGVRYRELSRLHNQLVTRAALALETYEIARDGILKIIEEVDIGLEKRTTLGSNLAPKSTVKEILVSRVLEKETPPTGVVEKQNVGSSRSMNNVADNSRTTDDNVKVRGWKVKEKKNVKSGKQPKSGLEHATRKKKHKKNNVSSSNNSFILHDINERGSQKQDLSNGANSANFGAFEPSTFHSSSQLPFFYHNLHRS
ncbi:hypothetical protein RD792_006639 [Penstemon davidsonii]|uniref:Protein FAR1-RELATED SEQUENCE n=1 Tax=Penstemon davidsonii TaxID=160366 RepID=A0ABR0DD93_9LAMI|nr:hypothetical protein RD792_006639 [Penstemon davidsonii]